MNTSSDFGTASGMDSTVQNYFFFQPRAAEGVVQPQVSSAPLMDFSKKIEEPIEEVEEVEKVEEELIRENNLKMMSAEAQAEAARIIADAKAEAARIKDAASEEGYRQGLEEGRNEGVRLGKATYEEKLQQFCAEAEIAVNEIEEIRRDQLMTYLDELKNVALAVAEKVIHVSLKSSGDVIKKMITAEAEVHKGTKWMKIYIDEQDYHLLQADETMVAGLTGISGDIKFVVMDDQPEGYVVMETPEEIVDLSVDTQLANIKDRTRTVTIGGDELDV